MMPKQLRASVSSLTLPPEGLQAGQASLHSEYMQPMRAKHCSLYSGEVWYNRADTGSLAIFPGKWCQARDVAVTSTLDSLGTLQFGGQVTLARRSSCQGALPSLHPRHMVKAYWTATGVTRKRGQLVASKQSVLPTRFLRASSTGNVP